MAQLGTEARGFPSCPEKQSPPFSPGLFPKIPSAPCTNMSLLLAARPGRRGLGIGCGRALFKKWDRKLCDKTAPPMVPNTLCFVLLLSFGFVTQPGLIKHGGFSCC